MIMKRCNRCGKEIPIGKRCGCQTAYKRNYNKFKRDRSIKEFRASKEWIRARNAAIERDGGIDIYLYHTTGEIKAGGSVHHIIPLAEDWSKRIDLDNLITLSEESHGVIEQMYKTNKREELQQQLKSIVSEYSDNRRGSKKC